MMKFILMILSAWVISASVAAAYCPSIGRAPQAPQSHEAPRPPSCLANAGYGREHDCTPRELDRYQVEVMQYLRRLDRFVVDVERYAEDAARYAQCEANEARATLER